MTKNESVIEEVTRKMQAMTKEPKFPKGWGLVGGKPFTLGCPDPTDTKRVMLLAAAEESYCQAATVLQPVLSELCKLWDEGHYDDVFDPEVERVRAGLHLLEEAIGAHNRYMDSVK